MSRLEAMEGVKVSAPQGAFYVLPDVSAFFGAGVSVEGFGEVPDGEALLRYLIEVAQVGGLSSSPLGRTGLATNEYEEGPMRSGPP